MKIAATMTVPEVSWFLRDQSVRAKPETLERAQFEECVRVIGELCKMENEVSLLRAMVEQARVPAHNTERCGSNDCPACEWLAFADQLGWPSWRSDALVGMASPETTE